MRAEWQYASQACSAYSLVLVSLYDTLGPNVVEYCVQHSEARVIFASSVHIATLLALSAACPTIKVIVNVDSWASTEARGTRPGAQNESVLKAWGAEKGVRVLDILERQSAAVPPKLHVLTLLSQSRQLVRLTLISISLLAQRALPRSATPRACVFRLPASPRLLTLLPSPDDGESERRHLAPRKCRLRGCRQLARLVPHAWGSLLFVPPCTYVPLLVARPMLTILCSIAISYLREVLRRRGVMLVLPLLPYDTYAMLIFPMVLSSSRCGSGDRILVRR